MTVRRRRIGVYGICRDRDRILLVRSDGSGWRLPGGRVDHGEDPRAALVRTVRAETGREITIDRVRLVRTDFVRDPGRDQFVHVDRVIFDVSTIGDDAPATVSGPDGVPAIVPGSGAGRGPDRQVAWMVPDRVPLRPWTAEVLGLSPAGRAPAEAEIAGAEPIEPSAVTHVQRFAAYGLTTDPAGRFLLTRIAAGYPGAGSWHLPGGGTDFGESATGGLARELAEETGQVGEVGALIMIEHFHNPAAYGPENRPIDWHTVRSVFRVTVTEPTNPIVHDLGGSTDAAAWFTSAELGVLNLNKLARSVISSFRQ